MDLAAQLGHRILPVLQGWAGRLRAEFPALTVNACDLGPHGVVLQCVFPGIGPNRPDVVTLRVALRASDNAHLIQSADVAWGQPSGHVEAEIVPVAAELSPERIEDVADRLPELFAALRQAVRRGRPPGT